MTGPRTGSAGRRKAEEQGRLFWVWLLTLPIILMMAASRAFGAPWPGPFMLRLAMVTLAFPVLFIVGEPLFAVAIEAARARRWHSALPVAALAAIGYLSGLIALVGPTPSLAGPAAILVSLYLTGRYVGLLNGRRSKRARGV